MYSFRTLAHPSVYCPPRSAPSSSSSTRPHAAPRVVSCSVGSPTVPLVPLKCQPRSDDPGKGWNPAMEKQFVNGRPSEKDGKKEDGGEEEKQGISGIYVPRQKFIPIPKRELLDGILSIFESEEDASEFLRFAKSLDSILHAEHKDILEQMRIYYSLMHAEDEKLNISRSRRLKEFMSIGQHFSPDSSLHASMMEINGRRVDKYEKQRDFYNGLDLQSLFGSSSGGGKTDADKESRVIATCFQHTFMKLLRNAQFEELSAEDLLLTYALNTDYLLTLPIYIDWKRASESNAVIFRRGYATEKQKGFLIIEKLDYLQSKLLQEMLFNISRPLKKLGIWITKALKNASETDELKILIEKLKAWMKGTFPQTPRSYVKGTFSDHLDGAHTEASELPIWLAAQRAAPRYEGFLSSIGPRGRLMRKLLSWIGFIPSMPEAAIELDTDSEVSEAYLRPNFLPRITLADIWKPASRDSCASNVWKMFKTGASILFSRSVLQEPAFQELILLYTDEVTQRESEKVEVMPLQLKIYKGIPYPDLPVIFPHKKLSFRILDTVRLDVASILGLLAYFVNYKFENILSSPSAIVLDVVAISALILYVTRVVLGYKQTWDRYQELPSIPSNHQYGKPAWLTPLLSKITFTTRGHLHQWGIESLLVFGKHYSNMFIHWEAIAALAEIWHPQTNTFIFPSFEATILLEEVALFLGLKDNKVKSSSVAHSVDQPSALEFMSRLTGDRLQARNIVNRAGIRLSRLAEWIIKAKEEKVEDEKLAQALSLCLAGLFFFPSHDDFLNEEFLGVMQSVWRGGSLTQAILAHLYSGLTLASLGKPLQGSMILLDIWISFHLKMDFCTDDSDIRIRPYDKNPISRVRDALHFTDKMIIKTTQVRSRSDWRVFLNNLPVVEFKFFSEALSKLKYKTRPCEGVELRLVGCEELILYNAHRCFLQLGQPRHIIPQLSHYPPIELRRFGDYRDQVDVRTCLELWKISKIRQAKLVIPEEFELVKAYVSWIKLLKNAK